MKNDGKELVPCYVGRAECGCMVSVQVADAKVSADELTEFFRGCLDDGLTIDRSTVGEVRRSFGHVCGKQISEPIEPPFGMKLWRSVVHVEVLIASETEPSDLDCRSAADEEISDNGFYGFPNDRPRLIEIASGIPSRWIGSIPRGESDRTCEQVVAEYVAAKEKAAAARPMPNQMSLPIETP